MLGAGGRPVRREPLGKSKVLRRLSVDFQSAAMWEPLRAAEKLTDGFIVWKAGFFFFSAVWRINAVNSWPPAIVYCNAALASHVIAEIGHLVSPSPPLVDV